MFRDETLYVRGIITRDRAAMSKWAKGGIRFCCLGLRVFGIVLIRR